MQDFETVRRVRAGETEYFSELVLKYRGALFSRMKRHLGNNEEAEEAKNEAVMRAFERLDRYDPEKAKFYTWLLAIARNIAFSMLRTRTRKPVCISQDPEEEETTVPEHPTVSNDPAKIYRAKCRFAKLQEFVKSLPPARRELVELLFDDYVKPPEAVRRLKARRPATTERKVRYALGQIARAANKSKLRTD